MSKSWHNFWYASFDPAGFITVDNPPVALWFMVICVKIFGLHGWSIVLSSVLFGIGSVYLIYKMVKPTFGPLTARIAAFFMTITPIVVADSQTNNMDATLVFFLLLAGWVLQRAVRKRRGWLVLVSFALVGVAFNIKMLQAYMVLPAMYLYYWVASRQNWKRVLTQTVLATLALAVVSLSWPLAVNSTSKSTRPYIGSSSTNSVLNLAFGYNGTQRLFGQTTGTGGTFSGMGTKASGKTKTGAPTGGTKQGGMKKPAGGAPTGQAKPTSGMKKGTTNGGKPSGKSLSSMPKTTKGRPTGMKGGAGQGGNGIFNVGTAGVTRLFQTALRRQISWFLPLALFGMVAAYLAAYDRKKKWWQTNRKQQDVLYWAGWLIPVGAFFSVANFFHPYYTIMLAPPLAVLAALAITSGLKKATSKRDDKRARWLRYLLFMGLGTTACLQSYYVWAYYPWLSLVILILTAVALVMMTLIPAKERLFLTLGVGFLCLAPGFWALTSTISGESAAVPTTGPSLLSRGGAATGLGTGTVNTQLIKYLKQHNGKSTTYLFATTDSNTAAPYIIKTGQAVMTIGGYNGTDNAISLKKFKQLVKDGKVKYFYISSHTNNNAIVKWVKKYGTKVSASAYGGTSSQTKGVGAMGSTNATLYRLSASK